MWNFVKLKILFLIPLLLIVPFSSYATSDYDYFVKHDGNNIVAYDSNNNIVIENIDCSIVLNYLIQHGQNKSIFIKNDNNYLCNQPITILSFIKINSDGSTLVNNNTLSWFIVSPQNQNLYSTEIKNIIIDDKNNAHAVYLYSVQNSNFDLTIKNSLGAFTINSQNQSKSTNDVLLDNSVLSTYDLNIDNSTIGLSLNGLRYSHVTDNLFKNVIITNNNGWGINFNQWCDSNTFQNVFVESNKTNTVGVYLNPFGNIVKGVYDEHFDYLIIDAWSTNDIGVKMGYTYQDTINHLFGSSKNNTNYILFQDNYGHGYIVNDMLNQIHYEKSITDIKN